uniref:Late endosomal/lysosomal adaptor and MAPK and MTOR activator 4 n=1 Tax=Haemonchus contortus TaxID=6289 RepID=A0A7I4YA06_HAECO
MAVDTTFAFLSKIPDQCGYLVISDGAIVKSDGELSNREATMAIVEKVLSITSSGALPSSKFYQITVSYTDHFYTIIESGRYTFVVKRKLHA